MIKWLLYRVILFASLVVGFQYKAKEIMMWMIDLAAESRKNAFKTSTEMNRKFFEGKELFGVVEDSP